MILRDASSAAFKKSAMISSDSFNVTVSSGDDRLLRVVVHIRGNVQDVSSITFNGDALTEAVTTSDGRTAIYYLVAPDVGEYVLAYSFAATVPNWVRVQAEAYTGVDQTDTLEATDTDVGTGTTGTVSATPAADGALFASAITSEDVVAPSVSPGSASEANDEGAWNSGSGYYIQGTAGAEDIDWTLNASASHAIALAVFNAAADTNTPPSTSLVTADDSELSTTPALTFVATDSDGDDVRYNVQIGTDPAFALSGVETVDSYETGASLSMHPNPLTTDGGQMDDRPGQILQGHGGNLYSFSLYLGDFRTQTAGDAYIRVYNTTGTAGNRSLLNAADPEDTPTQGWLAISDALPLDGEMATGWYEFTFSGSDQILLEDGTWYGFVLDWVPDSYSDNNNTFAVNGDVTGTGHDGNVYNDGYSAANNGVQSSWDLEFRLKETHVLLDKVSGTDAGFSGSPDNTDPFAEDQNVTFTVQTADELEAGAVYYWRARAKDPSGTDTYGAWATARSFTVDDTPTGTLSATLAAVTSSASADVDVGGTSSPTIAAVTASASADVDVIGESGQASLLSGDAMSGLMAYYGLEETSGEVHYDSHNSYDLSGPTVVSGTGVQGNAHDFSSDATYHNSAADLATGDVDFTIAVWVKPNSVTGNYNVLSKRTAASGVTVHEFLLRQEGTNMRMYVAGSNGVWYSAIEIGVMAIGEWAFIVGWHDPDANTVNVQVNGGTVISSVAVAPNNTGASTPFQISSPYGSGNRYNGLIDEVAFFHSLLTSDDRSALYNSGSGVSYADLGGGSSLQISVGLSSTGTVSSSEEGSLGATLADVSCEATGSPESNAMLSAVLEDLTASASASVGLTGSLAATIADVSCDATGSSEGEATLSAVLEDLTASASASVGLTGSLAATIADVSCEATGGSEGEATLSAVLEDLTGSASASVGLTGSLGATLASVSCEATGTVLSAGDATLVATLEDATATASATVDVSAAVDTTLAGSALAAQGDVQVTGQGAGQVDVSLESTGGAPETTGSLDSTVGDIQLSSVGIMEGGAYLAATLGDVSADADADVGIEGSAIPVLEGPGLVVVSIVALAAVSTVTVADVEMTGYGLEVLPEPVRGTIRGPSGVARVFGVSSIET